VAHRRTQQLFERLPRIDELALRDVLREAAAVDT